MGYEDLHTHITNAQRIVLIHDYPLLEVVCAPGHRTLRHPEAIEKIAQAIRERRLEQLAAEPILIGIFTRTINGAVQVRAIECLDGHHRLLGGLRAGLWRIIGDLPDGALNTRVNGWRASGAQAEPRWIPLEVAERSHMDRAAWSIVPPEWGAKGPTAMIAGDICGLDPVFDPEDRSVPLRVLLEAMGE